MSYLMLASVGNSQHFGGVLNRAPVMADCDPPAQHLSWRIRPWKPLYPVFNPVWCSVTAIEKSKKSAVTDVPCSQRAGVLGKVCVCMYKSREMIFLLAFDLRSFCRTYKAVIRQQSLQDCNTTANRSNVLQIQAAMTSHASLLKQWLVQKLLVW